MATIATKQNERRTVAKQRLNSYHFAMQTNKQLLQLIESADSRLLSVTSQLSETISSSTARDAMADQVVRIIELSEKMRDQSNHIAKALDDVLSIVMTVGEMDQTIGTVLSIRYLESDKQPTFDDIADSMCYSPEHIRRLHLEGLDMVADIIQA